MFKKFFTKKEKNTIRNILLHGHLFKNAGSTFDWSLKKNFGKSFIDHREDAALLRGRLSYFTSYILENQEIRAFSSHHLHAVYPPELNIENCRFFPVYFLRNTIERVHSVYHFERKQDPVTPGARKAKEVDFLGYVKWRMEPEVSCTIRNFQVRFLGGNMGYGLHRDNELEQAVKNMHFSFVGMVSRYDESLVVLEDRLRENFNNLDMSYVPQNINSESRLTPEQKAENVLEELGYFADTFIKNNELDIEFYKIADKNLDEMIEKTPDFEKKLYNFKKRCRRLA